MKIRSLLIVLIVLALLAAAFLLWNNFTISINARPRPLIPLPLFGSAQCGIENCHGLDISCGPNVAEVCDAMYMAGDTCRQFATCQVVNGRCELIIDSRFTACRSCVERCQAQFGEDAAGFFGCESACAQ